MLKAEADAKETLRKAKEEADQKVSAVIEEAKREAKEERIRLESQIEVEVRSLLLETKEECVSQAFAQAAKQLEDFVKTDAYHTLLVNLLKTASEKMASKSIVVTANQVDHAWLRQGLLDKLSSETGVRYSLSKMKGAWLGGCKVESADFTLALDETLEHRLQLLKPALRAKVARVLFGREEYTHAG